MIKNFELGGMRSDDRTDVLQGRGNRMTISTGQQSQGRNMRRDLPETDELEY